ncbi:MAG: hypothetical protein NVS3B12_32500 [Acidimicrobiales bacterium]
MFADCSRRELAAVVSVAREVRVPSGSVILAQGSVGDRFFVLAEGLAHVHVDGHPVASVGPGALFGEMALIEQAPRAASVIAELPCRLLEFSGEDFPALRAIPSVSDKVLQQMSQRLRAANAR